jgi:DNA-binding NtrC family response regulator
MAIDDEPDILSLVMQYLKHWGFDVDGFNDPLQALAHFKNNHERYWLVLTDIRMPSMTGFELATALAKIKPAIKIVLMTAFELTPRDLETLMPVVRYDELLIKPFRLVEVCTAVKRQLQEKQ